MKLLQVIQEIEMLMNIKLLIPQEENWTHLMRHLKKETQEQLLEFLNDLVDDDEFVVQANLRAEDENIQITHHPSSLMFKLHLGQTCFYTSRFAMDCVFYGALLHQVFNIKYPPNFKNLAAFILRLSGNEILAEKLSERILAKLKKVEIEL